MRMTIITISIMIIITIASNIVTDRHCGHLLLHLWGQEVCAVPGRRHLESRHRAGVRRSWGNRQSGIHDQEARKETREEAWKEARKRKETRQEARQETRKGKETRKEAWKGKEARKRKKAREKTRKGQETRKGKETRKRKETKQGLDLSCYHNVNR